MADSRPTRDELYEEAAASCGRALDRLARAYEPDPDSAIFFRKFTSHCGGASKHAFVVVGKLNKRKARQLRQKIDELRQ